MPSHSSPPRLGRLPAAVASAVLLATVLAGCATPLSGAGSAAPAQPSVPDAWSLAPPGTAVQAQAAHADWWTQFNDPQLTAWVAQALQANTTVRSAQAALQQARAQRDVTDAGQVPHVGASGSAQRSQVADNAPGNTFRAGFDASWEPDVFGAQRSARAASDADVQAAAASLGHARVSLAAEVAVTAIDLRGLQTRRRLAQDSLDKQRQALQLTEWRVQAGLASSLELAQARTAVEQTRAALPALDTGIRQSWNALAVLTGQAPRRWQQGATESPVPRPPERLGLSFPANTLRQRPDVRAAEQRVQAAWARVQQADANRYPSFQLSGSLGLNAPRLSDLFDLSALTRSVLASVTASLFDGGAAQAQVRVQQAALEQARLAHEAAVLAALQDVENALAALQGNRERLARLTDAAASAAQAELLARQRYASGLVDYGTLLDTQRSLLSVQSDLETTRATWSADHVRLYKALGGGWTPDPNTTAATAAQPTTP